MRITVAFRYVVEFGIVVILWQIIQILYSTRINTDIIPLHSPGRHDYNISMNQLATFRSSMYSSTIKYKWLFLSTYATYSNMMDRNYFAQYYAARRHPNIIATLWGISFPGYNSSIYIEENIRLKYGSPRYFDVIYIFTGRYEINNIRSVSRYTPIMMREHECWGYRCLSSIINNNISIFLMTYAHEIDLYHKSFSFNRVITHSPTSAEPFIFYPPLALNNDVPLVRDIDVLVVGARNSFVYPIRTRVAGMIHKGLIKNSLVHDHPGYSFANKTLEQTEEQTRTYAALLRRAKIVIVDSSRYSYALSKYSEVPLSGCLVLGDIPAERENEFRSYIVQISMNMTDEEILSIIDYWITHNDEREIKAGLGQKIVLNSYTWDHSIDVSLQALINYRQGQFGLFHNYPYTMKCVPMDNSNEKLSVSQWCHQRSKGIPTRALCECNRTGIDYFDEELDLDNWKGKLCDVNETNPRMYLVPHSLLRSCSSYEVINRTVHAKSLSSLCYCPTLEKTWRRANTYYVANTDLTISNYLACL